MKGFLKQPYPYEIPSFRKSLQHGFFIGSFIFVFLLVFQPFGLDVIPSPYKAWWIAGYGLITFASIVVFQQGAQKLFPNFFQEKSWTTGREIVENLSILLLIGLGNYFYTIFLGGADWSIKGFLFLLGATLSVGVFPIIGLVFLNYTKKLKENLKVAQQMERSLSTKHEEIYEMDRWIIIPSQYGQEGLQIPLDDLLWISAADNYVEVCFQQKGQLRKTLVRNNLGALEKDLSTIGVLRTHRSYMANLNQVSHIEGNAQGYQLIFEETQEKVPVSRKYAPQIKDWLES
ncbi:LytTR family DNA-binding domain-containing protein [Cecembia calidifontis]|uniref:LytTR family transcriptional regulator n=1 Tax=Cecembia calidifontis TaxID=1187080 RepID=A0A4Q7P6Y9_9BACT|nr:LytTR family DNA-binding domain-containing protein [Cecembia calidifontis]RZS95240.1 LytTR family transcriptional regulator [Cecembia calidifontis]